MALNTKTQHPGQLMIQWAHEKSELCKDCPPQCSSKCRRPTLLGGATVETAMEVYQTKMMCFLGWLTTNSIRSRIAFKKKVIPFSKFKTMCPHFKRFYLKKYDPNILISDLDSCGVSERTMGIIEAAKIHTIDNLASVGADFFKPIKGVGDKTYNEIRCLIKEIEVWQSIEWIY